MTELYSQDAEAAVLLCMMASQDVLSDVVVELDHDDFYSQKHRAIYQAIRDIYESGQRADAVTITDRLTESNKLQEAGGIEYISQIITSGYSKANVDSYVEIVRNKSTQRRLLHAAESIVGRVRGSPHTEVDSVLSEAEASLYEVGNRKSTGEPVAARDMVLSSIERIETRTQQDDPITGFKYGIDTLDKMTLGLHSGHLNIIAARPAMGKTSWVTQIALNVAIDQGVPVYIFELEMSKEDLIDRMVAQWSGVDYNKIRSGRLGNSELQRIGVAANAIGNSKLFIDDTASLNVTQLRSKARRLVRQHGKGLIIVDYLQLMEILDSNRVEGVGKVSRAAKLLSRELESPVVMLSQLSRACEQREDKRPRLSDLRDSGNIEQDADNVLFLYRPEVYYGKQDSMGNNIEGDTEIIVSKQRNGPIGIVRAKFDKKLMAFYEQI